MSNHQLKHNLESVIQEVNTLLGSLGPASNGIDMSSRMSDTLRDTQSRLSEASANLQARTRKAAKATDAYVHESPWQAVGLGTALGLIVGLLAVRR